VYFSNTWIWLQVIYVVLLSVLIIIKHLWNMFGIKQLMQDNICLCLFYSKYHHFNTTIIQRRVWRYQRGNHNPYIEEQTTQWPKENAQKDKQRSTRHTYKTKDRVTRSPLKTGGELRWFGRVGSSCSTSDTRRVNLPNATKLDVFIFIVNFITK